MSDRLTVGQAKLLGKKRPNLALIQLIFGVVMIQLDMDSRNVRLLALGPELFICICSVPFQRVVRGHCEGCREREGRDGLQEFETGQGKSARRVR